MLVTFRSTATESVTMLAGTATTLLKLMGATGRIPGALEAQDVPSALQQLQSAVEGLKAQKTNPADTRAQASAAAQEDDDRHDREPPVAIEVRAVPLLNMMKRAAAANAEIMWQGQ